MLCIEIQCEDVSEHIRVQCTCDDTIQIRSESEELARVWSDLAEQIEVFAEDASEHIIIDSDWTPSIEIWSSFVCSISEGEKYLILKNLNKTNPPEQLIVFISDKFTNSIDVISNLNWDINKI